MGEHAFSASVDWKGEDDGEGRVSAKGFQADIALPAQFGGTREGTNAEELLLSALGSCLVMTLAYVLENKLTESPQISAQIDGKFATGPLHLVSVAVSLRVGPTDASEEVVRDAVTVAEQRCMVSGIIRKTAPIDVRVAVLPGT